ncbi:MAG TPA: hypothetical protein PKA37_15470, partial [Planctomycetota bacterium]|nr:hypothetical protein [Planctomycetota bacterium]
TDRHRRVLHAATDLATAIYGESAIKAIGQPQCMIVTDDALVKFKVETVRWIRNSLSPITPAPDVREFIARFQHACGELNLRSILHASSPDKNGAFTERIRHWLRLHETRYPCIATVLHAPVQRTPDEYLVATEVFSTRQNRRVSAARASWDFEFHERKDILAAALGIYDLIGKTPVPLPAEGSAMELVKQALAIHEADRGHFTRREHVAWLAKPAHELMTMIRRNEGGVAARALGYALGVHLFEITTWGWFDELKIRNVLPSLADLYENPRQLGPDGDYWAEAERFWAELATRLRAGDSSPLDAEFEKALNSLPDALRTCITSLSPRFLLRSNSKRHLILKNLILGHQHKLTLTQIRELKFSTAKSSEDAIRSTMRVLCYEWSALREWIGMGTLDDEPVIFLKQNQGHRPRGKQGELPFIPDRITDRTTDIKH